MREEAGERRGGELLRGSRKKFPEATLGGCMHHRQLFAPMTRRPKMRTPTVRAAYEASVQPMQKRPADIMIVICDE